MGDKSCCIRISCSSVIVFTVYSNIIIKQTFHADTQIAANKDHTHTNAHTQTPVKSCNTKPVKVASMRWHEDHKTALKYSQVGVTRLSLLVWRRWTAAFKSSKHYRCTSSPAVMCFCPHSLFSVILHATVFLPCHQLRFQLFVPCTYSPFQNPFSRAQCSFSHSPCNAALRV